MSDWLKMVAMLAGVAITMYATQREQSYRLSALEKEFDDHLQLHNNDLSEIRKDVNAMKVDLARVALRECSVPSRSTGLEQNQWAK
jgi:hypothetical protein